MAVSGGAAVDRPVQLERAADVGRRQAEELRQDLLQLLLVDVPGPVPGYRNFVESDFWEEDGSAEFEKIWNETESGPYWVEP